MSKFLSFLTLLISSFLYTQAQNLNMPRDVKEAFKKGTRTASGRPGKIYWQNYGRYNITVSALPPSRIIKGKEEITYINHSPDTLKSISIKLIQNIHKSTVVRYSNTSTDYLTAGVQVDKFLVDGQLRKWPTNATTVQTVALPNQLLPQDSIQLSFDWQFEISKQSGREGMIDSTTYFLAYFYPRVAVYDDYNGWDKLDFTDQQEFYNDFNDYTLNIQAPKNFIVWATGTLQNPAQVLQPLYAKRLAESMMSDSTIHIATKEELADKKVTAQNEINVWKFIVSNISDVAFGISDHYLWDAASTIVDNTTKRRASVQSAYADTAKDFQHAVKWGAYALNWYSHNWPGVPYPFPKMTIFHGNADMEYPMMVNDSSFPNLTSARRVEDHEIAHTWFPFYMGINEHRFAFMDEGWAAAHEYLIGLSYKPADTVISMFRRNRVSSWYSNPGADLPIITPSYEQRIAYRPNAYGKPAVAYLALKDMLGKEMFRKCLHEYMNRWNGKHPLPWDFFNTFNNVSGKDLNWFWNSWFFSNGYIDLGLQKPVKTSQGYTVSIDNIGGFPTPVNLNIVYTDGATETIHKTPIIWSTNQKQAIFIIPTKKDLQSLHLDDGIFMDADETNNKWEGTSLSNSK